MRRALLLGGLLIAAAFAAGLALAVPPFIETADRIESFPKTRISEGAVELRSGEYDVYIDVPSSTPESTWSLTLRDPQRREVPILPSGGSITYDWFGRSGERVGKVRITAPGRHLVRGSGPPGARVVFADDVFGGVGKGLLAGAAAFFLLAAAGVVVIVVALARRGPREPKRWP